MSINSERFEKAWSCILPGYHDFCLSHIKDDEELSACIFRFLPHDHSTGKTNCKFIYSTPSMFSWEYVKDFSLEKYDKDSEMIIVVIIENINSEKNLSEYKIIKKAKSSQYE